MPKLKSQCLEGQERLLTANHSPPSFSIYQQVHGLDQVEVLL